MKHLFFGKKRTSGRNHRGIITIRFRGGGNKRRHRCLNFRRSSWMFTSYVVQGFVYDPFRTAFVAVVCATSLSGSYVDEKPRLMLSPRGFFVGHFFGNQLSSSTHAQISFVMGSYIVLRAFPVGSFVHNIELLVGGVGKLCRAAGTCAQIVEHFSAVSKTLLRLPSGALYSVSSSCGASLGVLGNGSQALVRLRKAGQNRWFGYRPHVRGVAINPVDHAHGGGEGKGTSTRGGVNPWGRAKKGQKTRFILICIYVF